MKKVIALGILVVLLMTVLGARQIAQAQSVSTPTANCGESGPTGLQLCERIVTTPTANCGESGPTGLQLCERIVTTPAANCGKSGPNGLQLCERIIN